MTYIGATGEYQEVRPIHWPNGKVPKARPKCGFDGKDPSCQVSRKGNSFSFRLKTLACLFS